MKECQFSGRYLNTLDQINKRWQGKTMLFTCPDCNQTLEVKRFGIGGMKHFAPKHQAASQEKARA